MSKKKMSGWVKLVEVLLLIAGAFIAVFATKKAQAKSKAKKSVNVAIKKSSKKRK